MKLLMADKTSEILKSGDYRSLCNGGDENKVDKTKDNSFIKAF
jgi:hypothetical protein